MWKELETGRYIKILEVEVYGTGPSWTYCDRRDNPEPESEEHKNWYWHYCDVLDFAVWGRFKLVR